MGLGGVISNILSLGNQLLPFLSATPQAPSSSSSFPPTENHQIETELNQLLKLLERITATLYDAEEREIRDESVKLWLKELRGVAYDAEDVLDEYRYEVLRAQVEARDASAPNSRKRKLVQVPYGMLNQIKQIRSTFVDIVQHREALQLSEAEAPRRCHTDMQIAPTSHLVVESDIIGREREKEELINLLFSESHGGEIISVVAIVGTGGIGKTTLAQLVHSDQRIKQKFDKLLWICVSQVFNVQRLTKEVVELITGNSCDLTNLGALQKKISKKVRGKRIFLVLDDVWNDNTDIWESFRKPFMSAFLVKILVTTRNKPVASIMQTVPTFDLDYMSEEQSWQLFEHYAFGGGIQTMGSNFVKIGKLIMKKCGMLPLAVKSVASLLRLEPNEESWREILESELWQCNAGIKIFQPLYISYARLPTYLKPCFLYCSMFPKDYRYSAKELVKLWISQGYVQNNGLKDVKKVGWEYAKQLWQRSFFQGEYDEKEFYFTLHDVVHDLARSISGHGCYSIESDKRPDFPKELYHLSIGGYSQKNCVKPPPFPSEKFTPLRTFFNIRDYYCWNYSPDFPKELYHLSIGGFNFSEAKKLRALQLTNSYVKDHFSFVDLKHLRFLSLCDGRFRRLPECICSLYNLQFLTIHSCYNLIELPESIKNLVSLEELTIQRCGELKVLPVFVCQLKALDVRLECSTIGWLEHFVDLDGRLVITMRGVPNLEDVRCADLASMHNLHCLKLIWRQRIYYYLHPGGEYRDYYIHPGGKDKSVAIDYTGCGGDAMSDIGLHDHSLMVCLQPHPNLKMLHLEGYRSRKFPDWLENPTLCASLESISLEGCLFITFLPFGGLPKLKHLKIEKCSSLQFIEEESLPSVLEEVKISNCENLLCVTGIQWLKSLVKLEINECTNISWLDHFGKADIITVSRCRKFKKFCSQHHISYEASENELDDEAGSTHEMLEIKDYSGLTFSKWVVDPIICASLKRIYLESCESITFLPFGSLDKLKYLSIWKCSNLQFIHEGSLPLALEQISISRCKSLISVTGIQRLKSLVKLEITCCENLCWLDHCGEASNISVSGYPKIREFCSEHDFYCKASENELDEEVGDSTHKMLEMEDYSDLAFPKWSGNPTICASLESIYLSSCESITFLPFGSLDKLKYLRIWKCTNLQFIHEESLPLALEEISISRCKSLISVTGIQRLKSLVKLEITCCENLCWLDPCGCGESCNITVRNCPKLRELCSQNGIRYEDVCTCNRCHRLCSQRGICYKQKRTTNAADVDMNEDHEVWCSDSICTGGCKEAKIMK